MDLLESELKKSFAFFIDQANRNPKTTGYGLVVDNTAKPTEASIASVGFGLTMLPIGVERGYITRQDALKAARLTLRTFLDHISHHLGFFIHFVNIDTGAPRPGCEYSTIDTAIFLNGAVVVDAYFDDLELHELFNSIYGRIDWNAYVFERDNKLLFRMAYNPVEGGDYRQKSSDPWIWQWDMTAEQLSLYFLAAGSEKITPDVAKRLYRGFNRNKASYKDYEYVYSPGNALFVYQYSHAWIDFHNYRDPDGFDWAKNTRIATYANREWCIDHKDRYPILGENMWGVTSCLTPKGYRGQGVTPTDSHDHPDGHFQGAIPPSGVLGSLPYAPEIVIPAVKHMASTYPESIGEYGFKDAIAIVKGKPWIAPAYIGIDKGISALMIDNYLSGTTWKLYMHHPLIRKASQKLGFTEKR